MKVRQLGINKQAEGWWRTKIEGRRCSNQYGSKNRDRSLWRTSGLWAFNNAVTLASLTALAHLFTRTKKAFYLSEIK